MVDAKWRGKQTDEANAPTDGLIRITAVPQEAGQDAPRFATAVAHGVEYLVPTNLSHLANPKPSRFNESIRRSRRTHILIRKDVRF